METSVVVPSVSQDSATDVGVIIAELHQTEKIETVVVTGDFIELGSSYETSETTNAGSDEMQVFGVVNVEQNDATAADNGMEECYTRTHICDMFLAEGRVPTWQTLFDQVLEEEGGVAFAGVCSSLQAALRLKELYEDETVTQYRAKSTVATFGRTEFQRTALRRATFRLMDVRLYTPIFILAKNRYVCHKGPDIDKGLKEKRKRAHLSGGYNSSGEDDSGGKSMKSKRRKVLGGSEFAQTSKRQRHCQLTKKVGCPATLTMYEVLIANCEDADFDDELSWKVRIATQEIDLQRFIVVFLPRYHEGHEIGHSSASCVSRSWHPDVRAKLTSLLIDGIRDPDEMMTLLKHYVETNLCASYATKPNVDDRRYYPLRTDIRNAIAYDLKEKKILVKPDEDRLMALFQQWTEADPNGHVFYRPCSYSATEGQQNMLLVYQSSDQQYLMRRYGAELMFLDKSTACGIPVYFLSVRTNCIYHLVSFFLSSVDTVVEGLAVVKSWNPDLEPKFIMCDPDNTHFTAVEATWPSSQLLLCDYCREQDWMQWMESEESGLQHKQQCKQQILTLLRQIADANSQDELSVAQHRFMYDKLYTDSYPLQSYYVEHYLPIVEQWVQFHRHGLHTKIDANNASQRREGLMRKHYEQSNTANFTQNIITVITAIKQTVDTMWLDYCKTNMAQAKSENEHELEDAVSHLANRPHNFCNLQLKAYHKAKRFLHLCSDIPSVFKRLESDTFLMKDFNASIDKWHKLELTNEPSCSCSTFHKHKMPCHHFYAVFAAFDDVSWYSLPASYRNLPLFTLDPRCLQLPGVTVGGNSEAEAMPSINIESVRSVNISRLTGLLDKIKASARNVDNQSLTSCVEQVEAAASLVEKAPPLYTSPSSTTEQQSFQPACSRTLETGSDADDHVETFKVEQSSAFGNVVEERSISHKSFPSKISLKSQRLLQQLYVSAATENNTSGDTESVLSDTWIQQGDIILSHRHHTMLYHEELDNTIVAASLALLRAEDTDGHYSGLLSPILVSTVQFEGRHNENLIQVMKVDSELAARWVCVSTVGCQAPTVDVYDCAVPSTLDEEIYTHAVKTQVAALLTLPLDHQSFTLHSKPVIQRDNATVSSGLYAIAFATDLVYYQNVVGSFDQKSLASHLASCLSSGRLVPFPKSDIGTICQLSPSFMVEVAVFCKCRLPCSEMRDSDDDLLVMCSADTCVIHWYHLRCVGSTDARGSTWSCDLCLRALCE